MRNILFAIVVTLTQSIISSRASHQIDSQYDFPIINFADLVSLDFNIAIAAASHLTSVGVLQIKGIPNFKELRQEALGSLAVCQSAQVSHGVLEATMNDGSIRLTTGASSSKGVPSKMSTHCGDSSNNLRFSVDSTTRQLFRALDIAAKNRELLNGGEDDSSIMDPYRSFDSLINNGDHIEHLHSYFSKGESDVEDTPVTMDTHIDSGLLIAMTTGLYSDESNLLSNHGLYIQLPSDEIVRAGVDEDALIIMVGAMASWLSPILGKPLRPVPHFLISGLPRNFQHKESRSWFGKMYLPPADARVPKDHRTYGELRLLQESALSKPQTSGGIIVDYSSSLPSACGDSWQPSLLSGHQRRLAVVTNTVCYNPPDGYPYGVKCWMQCMSVAGLPCGVDAVCIDTTTGQVNSGTGHCPTGNNNCKLTCSNATYTPFDGYCYGTGTSMLMEGFQSIAQDPAGTTACLNLLFVSWTLDSQWKYGIGCVGTLLLGIAVQGITLIRSKASKFTKTYRTVAIIIALYGLQATMSYFLMLIAMTYSVELFCMVCVGLTIGYALFNVDLPAPASAEPCCNFEDDLHDKLNPVIDPSSHGKQSSRLLYGEKGDC